MCGGWACASYNIACCNPRLSTLRFSGRCFQPTPCGPRDDCSIYGGCCGGCCGSCCGC